MKIISFYSALLRAQACSDAGKDLNSVRNNGVKCLELGYSLKDKYIKEAIANIPSNCFFYIERTIDFGGSLIIYFETPQGQISFHSFGEYSPKLEKHFQFTHIEWNGDVNGSRKTCKRIERRFNLQVFKRS